MSAEKCGACDHDPACGYALVGDVRYCHDDCGDAALTCYEMVVWAMPMQYRAMWANDLDALVAAPSDPQEQP